MTINIQLISPYSSYIILQKTNAEKITIKIVNELIENVKKSIKNNEVNIISCKEISPKKISNIKYTKVLHLVEERNPKWAGGNNINDSINHLIAFFINDDFSVIYTNEPHIKSAILGDLSAIKIKNWIMVDESILINAFITGNALKTLWLGGTHSNIPIKPNSKIISGDDLNDAIDPFGDSTFIAGAVRSSIAGISLKRSGVWFGPNKNWSDFSLNACFLLKELKKSKSSLKNKQYPIIHQGLAQNIYDISQVEQAYHIEFTDIDTLKGVRKKEKLTNLINDYQFDEIITKSKTQEKQDICVKTTHISSKKNSIITISPEITNKKLSLNIINTSPKEFNTLIDTIKNNIDFIKIFYTSGHTITNASLSYSTVQDRDFNIEFMDFEITKNSHQYSVTKEKPTGNPPNITDIFTVADDSLFKWVFKEGLSQLGLHIPEPSLCWLYCDDRSGEVADFIHVDKSQQIPKITLIHVKGANSDSNLRRISPSAYEIVVAQAMKNFRRIVSSTMLNSIESAVNKYKNDRVWDKPWDLGLISSFSASQDFLNALKTITTNCSYEVIVIQPHILKSKYLYLKDNKLEQSKTTGAMQLRSLLFGAKAMANSASATFRVISDNR